MNSQNDSVCERPVEREPIRLAADELEFLIWFRRLLPSQREQFANMLQDAEEMHGEGYEVEDIRVYLTRTYGL